jgi:hypothetical protein
MKCEVCGKTLYGIHRKCEKVKELESMLESTQNDIRYLRRELESTNGNIKVLSNISGDLCRAIDEVKFKTLREMNDDTINSAKACVELFLKEKLEEEWKKISEKSEW